MDGFRFSPRRGTPGGRAGSGKEEPLCRYRRCEATFRVLNKWDRPASFRLPVKA